MRFQKKLNIKIYDFQPPNQQQATSIQQPATKIPKVKLQNYIVHFSDNVAEWPKVVLKQTFYSSWCIFVKFAFERNL